jgi:hypothetical protein
MLRDHFRAFDDFVTTGQYDTNDDFAERLGKFDQIAIFVVLEDPVKTIDPAFVTVRILHSGDGIHWTPKDDEDPEVSMVFPLASNSAWGRDTGVVPSLPFVRLQVTSLGISARVKVYVALRDIS